MTSPGFIHLHVHSAYSLLEGALQFGKVLELAKGDKSEVLPDPRPKPEPLPAAVGEETQAGSATAEA